MKYLKLPDESQLTITLPIGLERAEETCRTLFPKLLKQISKLENDWDKFDALAGLYKSLRSHLDYLDELEDLKSRSGGQGDAA